MTFPSLEITIPWYHANIRSDFSQISEYYWIIKILRNKDAESLTITFLDNTLAKFLKECAQDSCKNFYFISMNSLNEMLF